MSTYTRSTLSCGCRSHGLCHLLLPTLISLPVVYWLLHSSVLSHLSVLSQQKSELLKNPNSFTLTLPSHKAGSGEQGSVRKKLGLQWKGQGALSRQDGSSQ